MESIQQTFFNQYTRVDALLKQVYALPQGVSGVTHYLNLMQSADSVAAKRIAQWDVCYKTLRRLRHHRNRMAHEAGAFESEDVRADDVRFLMQFYTAVRQRNDPIACFHQQTGARYSTAGRVFLRVLLVSAAVIAAAALLCAWMYFST